MDADSPAEPAPGPVSDSDQPRASITNAYTPRPEAFDELLDAHGQVRPAFRTLVKHLDALGADELERRWLRARQLIHENGVSYNVHGDPKGLERPWLLSPIPVVLEAAEWSRLSRGVEQRGRLLQALLADLYGPQRALTSGWAPPELVFGNPGFLRPLHGHAVPKDDWLPFYGTDVQRAPDGSFYAVDDRLQSPTGAGYALENRIVVSSALPEPFRECNVERLARFFRGMREQLADLAPHDRDNPRIVLLTPGPYDATYFEQAYLAQYLGFTLVTGGDLTVRDHRVYLKTLGGLQPVDVVFRRVQDDFCDPLELRADSMLGVPGLVQAARAGNVAIANPLGTGVAQSPAWLPYLPALCRGLLGEALELPSVRTWWCGDPEALPEVIARFDRLILRPTFYADGGQPPVATATLSADERAQLLGRVCARPAEYVAQEPQVASTTPLWHERALEPAQLVLRLYAASTRGRDYRVMPGGLARVHDASADGVPVTMQRGARAKDVWVLSGEPVSTFSLLPPAQRPVVLSRGGGDLPSRAADNLFWLGRYAERAESIARLVRVIGARLSDLSGQHDLDGSGELRALLAALRAQTEFLYSSDIPVDAAPTLEGAEAQLQAAVRDQASLGSLASVVGQTLRTGRLVRDRISADTWRVLAALDEDLGRAAGPDSRPGPSTGSLDALVSLLNRVVITLAGFSGLAMESMTRGHGWRFLDLGRRLERAVALLTLLRATTVPVEGRERPLLEATLEIADSVMTFRRRYLAMLQVAPVVDLLFADETNPRSVVYQVRAIAEHVRALPPPPGGGVRSPQLRIAISAQHEIELAEIERLCQPAAPGGTRSELDALLRKLGGLVAQLSESLSDSYLTHATLPRHMKGGEEP